MAALLVVGFEVALGELIAPHLQLAAKQKKVFSKFSDVTFGSGSGAWVRDGNLIISAAKQSGERQFGGMMVFELSSDHRLRAIGHADRATSGATSSEGDAGAWMLHRYAESRFSEDHVITQPVGERKLDTRVSADFLGLAVSSPNDLQIATLYRLIRYYQQNALDARPYVFAFWSRIARTVGDHLRCAARCAVCAGVSSLCRRGGAHHGWDDHGGRFCFCFSGYREWDAGVRSQPGILAWLPTTLLAALSLTLLARAR